MSKLEQYHGMEHGDNIVSFHPQAQFTVKGVLMILAILYQGYDNDKLSGAENSEMQKSIGLIYIRSNVLLV